MYVSISIHIYTSLSLCEWWDGYPYKVQHRTICNILTRFLLCVFQQVSLLHSLFPFSISPTTLSSIHNSFSLREKWITSCPFPLLTQTLSKNSQWILTTIAHAYQRSLLMIIIIRRSITRCNPTHTLHVLWIRRRLWILRSRLYKPEVSSVLWFVIPVSDKQEVDSLIHTRLRWPGSTERKRW